MRTPPEITVGRDLAAIRRAYKRAVRTITEHPDTESAFRAAQLLATGLRELYDGPDGATRVVARAAVRLRAARRYSLAELARVVEVSKSMAAYWDRRGRERVKG